MNYYYIIIINNSTGRTNCYIYGDTFPFEYKLTFCTANTFVAPYADFIDHDLVAGNCSHANKCVLNLDGCRKL